MLLRVIKACIKPKMFHADCFPSLLRNQAGDQSQYVACVAKRGAAEFREVQTTQINNEGGSISDNAPVLSYSNSVFPRLSQLALRYILTHFFDIFLTV